MFKSTGPSANSSTSGCEESDFLDFPSGNIAVLQRYMHFCTKVANAQAAGVGVVIFNEGQSGRRGVVEGMLEESGSTIPVVGIILYW